MRVLHLSTDDFFGGAARAAYRLHRGLLNCGENSRMMVQYKITPDDEIVGPCLNLSKAFALLRPTFDSLLILAYHKRTKEPFHSQWIPDLIHRQVKKLKPDVIHLHWICRGFININSLLRFQTPIVWTLHDMWPFTGGCHYTNGCKRFIHSCGRCPILKSNAESDLSRWNWKRKFRALRNINLKLIAPSRWIASQAAESSLLKNIPCSTIPNGIDTDRFKPLDQELARKLLKLPHDKTLILFTAMDALKDRRKGIQYLLPAIRILAANVPKNNIALVVLGSESSTEMTPWGTHIYHVGELRDEISIALVYTACDVFVAPSEEDNLPNTVVEALCCGIPCVTFNLGGMTDLIVHKKSGYLAEPYSVEDLSRGINWVTASTKRKTALGKYARYHAVKKFSIHRIANQHLKIYNWALNGFL